MLILLCVKLNFVVVYPNMGRGAPTLLEFLEVAACLLIKGVRGYSRHDYHTGSGTNVFVSSA